MEIAALGIAVGYVIVIVAGAALALLLIVRLFGETPVESKETGLRTVEGSSGLDRSGAASTPAASTGPERSEDEAA